MTALDSFLEIAQGISPESEFLVDMNAGGPGVVSFEVAHIATDLVPLADRYLTGASRIKIVGADGASVCQENYRWTGDLMRWVELGAHVEYLLLNPGESAIARLSREAEKSRDSEGSLHVIRLDANKAVKNEDAALLQRWQTFHFISFSDPKQLWVEQSHPAGSVAHDCAYYSPPAAERSAAWDLLTAQFEHVVNTYGECVIHSDDRSRAKQPQADLLIA